MTIKVFIGSEPKTEIPRKVLEYSIRKHTKMAVKFPGLQGNESWAKRPASGVGTGFSLLRWDIPARCDYRGFAIYLDADQLVMDDINDLYSCDEQFPNNQCSCWCTYQPDKWFKEPSPNTSVMLIDCAKARFNQQPLDMIESLLEDDPKRKRYVKIMHALDHTNAPQRIPEYWNRLNNFIPGKTKLLHYTKEPKQPWYDPTHPHRSVWERYLKECMDEGIVTKEEISLAISSFKPHTKTERGTGMNPNYNRYL